METPVNLSLNSPYEIIGTVTMAQFNCLHSVLGYNIQ